MLADFLRGDVLTARVAASPAANRLLLVVYLIGDECVVVVVVPFEGDARSVVPAADEPDRGGEPNRRIRRAEGGVLFARGETPLVVVSDTEIETAVPEPFVAL